MNNEIVRNDKKYLKNQRKKLKRKFKKMLESNSIPLVGMETEESSAKRPKTNFTPDQIQNTIPIFNPNSPFSLNSQEWINAVEYISSINNWNDKLTLLYATQRLKDANMCFGCNMTNWQEFKSRFVQVFPIWQHRSQYIGELFKRSKSDSESYEEYAYDVAILAGKCNFESQTMINLIISGLPDVNMRNRLIAYDCQSIAEILANIQTIAFDLGQEANGSISNLSLGKTGVREENNNLQNFVWPPESKTNQAPTTSSLSIVSPDWNDLIKPVKVDDVHLTALVDLSSQFTTLREREFLKNGWQMKSYEENFPRFGQRNLKPLGKISKTVLVDQVEVFIEIMIVQDEVQQYPMILGRNFLDNPNVTMVKSSKDFEIVYVEAPTTMPPVIHKKKRKPRKRRRRFSNGPHEQVRTDQERNKGVVKIEKHENTLAIKQEITSTISEEANKTIVIKKEKPDEEDDRVMKLLNSIETDFL